MKTASTLFKHYYKHKSGDLVLGISVLQ